MKYQDAIATLTDRAARLAACAKEHRELAETLPEGSLRREIAAASDKFLEDGIADIEAIAALRAMEAVDKAVPA